MQHLYKVLNKPDLVLSMNSCKIYTCSYLQQAISHSSETPRTTLELQDEFNITLTDLETIIQQLLWKNEVRIIHDLIVNRNKYEEQLENLFDQLKKEKQMLLTKVPKIFLQEFLYKDEKYLYDDEFLRVKGYELSQVISQATQPFQVSDLGIDLDLLKILRLKYTSQDTAHWLGSVIVPKVYILDLEEILNNELNKNGIVNSASYEYINLTQMVDSNYILDKYIMSREFILKQASNIQLELKKKGCVQLTYILDVKVSEKILKVLQDHLTNTTLVSNFYIHLELLKVIKVELKDLVKEIAESIRIKISREDIQEMKKLGFQNVLADYVPEEVRRDLEEMLEKDFMRKVEEEVNRTFKEDLGTFKMRDLRMKVRRIEGFYRGLQFVNDKDLRVKLEKLLLNVKGQEVLQTLGIIQDIKDWKGWKKVIAKKIDEEIYDLEVEIEKEDYLQKLKEQLKDAKDAALVLHLVISILFVKEKGYSIYFTGKSVPDVLRELRNNLPEDTFAYLDECLKKIINQKKTKDSLDHEILRMKEML